MPRIAPIAPAEIRPAASAPHSKDAGDPFEQLLQARGRDDRQPDEPHTRGMESTSAQAVDHDRDSARRTDRRDDTDRADQPDVKTDRSQTDDTGQASAKDKSASTDDASTDTDGKSKDHKSETETTPDAVATAPAADAPQSANVNATTADVAAVPAPVIPAKTDVAAAPTPALAPVQTGDAVQAPEAAAAPAPVLDVSATAAAAAATGKSAAGKTKANTGFEIPAPVADDTQPVTADDQKVAANAATQTAVSASANAVSAAPKFAFNTAPQDGQPAVQDKNQGKNAALANIATEAAAKTGVKPETANASSGQESLESALSKHFSADAPITNASQIVLPDASRVLPNNLTPVNAPAQNMPAAASSHAVPLASAALAIEIASRSKDGSRQFDIRLDPPELGRIEVKLDVDKTGQVNTHLTVDRPETLDLLRRDSQGLERALQQAGLKTSDGGLEFSLRQQTPDGSFNDRNQAQTNARAGIPVIGDSERTAIIHAEQYQWAARMRGGVDIRV